MGKTITTIVIALIVILGIYYVARNRVTIPGTTTYSSSTNATSGESGEYGSSTGSSSQTGTTASTSNATTSKNIAMDIKNFAYSPATLTVKKGTKITWTNRDSAPHTVTSTSGNELNSQTLTTGQTYSHTFNGVGTFNYYCTIHPNMKGTIIVTE